MRILLRERGKEREEILWPTPAYTILSFDGDDGGNGSIYVNTNEK